MLNVVINFIWWSIGVSMGILIGLYLAKDKDYDK